MEISIYSNGITIEGNSLKKSTRRNYVTLEKDGQFIALINIKDYRLLYAGVMPKKCKYYKLIRKEDLWLEKKR